MTAYFQEKINNLKDTFLLSNLSKFSESQYKVLFDQLNIDIPFQIFQRNVMMAMKRATKITRTGKQTDNQIDH